MNIVVILFRRSNYTRLCLQHLASMRGIERCQVLFQIEPFCPGVVRQAFEWTFSPSSVMINNSVLGCNKNLFTGIDRAFNTSNSKPSPDMVGIIEDDVLVSKDWLEFVQRPDLRTPETMAICTYRRHTDPILQPDYNGYERCRAFCPWGWATWKNKWEKIRNRWVVGNQPAWDTHLNRIGTFSPGSIVAPMLGRAFNCGSEEGTYCHSVEEYYKNNHTPYWAEKLV